MLDGVQFHRSEVLNHRVDAGGILRHGDVMEGLVLAECFSHKYEVDGIVFAKEALAR